MVHHRVGCARSQNRGLPGLAAGQAVNPDNNDLNETNAARGELQIRRSSDQGSHTGGMLNRANPDNNDLDEANGARGEPKLGRNSDQGSGRYRAPR